VIVVDTNVISYLMIPGERSPAAREVLRTDPDWRAPILWRSEFRNVLATRIRKDQLTVPEAMDLVSRAEALMEGREHHVASAPVLEVAGELDLSAYDAEFVTLARVLDVRIVTNDARILERLPDRAVPMEGFADSP
jgi:predicted nucleic acid-binding protein